MSIESISNSIASSVLANKSAKKEAVDNKSATAITASSKDDTVSITSITQGLPEQTVDDSRVARIRAAIQDGSYVVDPERIAKKMLQFEFNIPDST